MVLDIDSTNHNTDLSLSGHRPWSLWSVRLAERMDWILLFHLYRSVAFRTSSESTISYLVYYSILRNETSVNPFSNTYRQIAL